jgi:phosphate transport system substrate-binding protein
MLVCSAGLVTAVSTSPPAFAGGPAISGTGSSYAALAINQWNAEVSSEFQDTVNYSTTSSVIGLNDFAQYPQVDFGASEIGYSTKQANNNPPGGFNYQYLPDIAGATCLDYNLNNQLGQKITNLNLNSSVLAGIFSGAISSWNAPAIQSLNSGVLLPNTPIVMVYRTDASGDNFIFSDYLYTLQQGAWNAFTSATQSPAGPAAIWPTAPSGARTIGQYNFSNWTGENGSDNASNYVYGNTGTITYVETGYALLHNDPCAAVTNSSGANVKPTEAADAIALQNDQLQSDLEQDLGPVFTSPQSGAYPISAYSYLIMAEQSEIPTSKQAVEAQYVRFLACDGQKAAGVLGYSPLPPNLVQADFDAVQRITGTALPPPTASNCADPYITGQFNAAPPPVIATTGPTTPGAAAGAAVSPVAGIGASAVSAGAKAATGSTGGHTNTVTTLSPTAQAAAAARASAKAAAKAANRVSAAPGQQEGVALQAASDRLLGSPGPGLSALLATLAFLAFFMSPPIIALTLRKRRSDQSLPTEGHE